MDIEVELRSFVTKEKYDELASFFAKNGKLVGEEEQESHYLDDLGNLRIQQSTTYSKIWFKKGKLHDEQREEIEIKTGREDFGKLASLFASRGYKTHVKWVRKRKVFGWKGVDVMLDYTRGYGYIVELEKMSDEKGKDSALALLKERFGELGVEPSPREEFDRKYRDYKENWEKLIAD